MSESLQLLYTMWLATTSVHDVLHYHINTGSKYVLHFNAKKKILQFNLQVFVD